MTEIDVGSFYGDSYYAGGAYFDYIGDRPVMEQTFRKKIDILDRYLRPSDEVFEIGCAHGFFLNLLRARHVVSGIDVSPAALYARDVLHLPVTRGDFLKTELPNDLFGMVCMWDTIEHLIDPGAYVAKIANILRPGGHLAITTGDLQSLVARVRGQRWRLIDPPAHLSYFSRDTLTALLAAHGLRPVLVRSLGTYRSVRQVIAAILRLMPGKPRLDDFLERLPPTWAFYLDIGDIMLVVAEKPSSDACAATV